MTPQRVSLITLGVDDLDRARAFHAAPGWTPAQTLDEITVYQMNGLVPGLFGKADLAAGILLIPVGLVTPFT